MWMAAVATIDILAGVHNLNEADDDVIGMLIASGWEHRPYIDVMIPNRRFFHKPPGADYRTTRTCHVHVVEHSSPEWQDPISFRDFLRVHPEAARQYLDLKRSLALQEYENLFV